MEAHFPPVLWRIAQRLRPELAQMEPLARIPALFDIFVLLYTAPLAVAGLLWLLAVPEYTLGARDWLTLLLLLLVSLLFRRFSFEIELQIRKDAFAATSGSLQELVLWSAALLFGPVALWLPVADQLVAAVVRLRRTQHRTERWFDLRTFVSSVATQTLAGLVGLWVYVQLGGVFPPTGLDAGLFVPALVASLVVWLMLVLLMLPALWYLSRIPAVTGEGSYTSPARVVQFFLVAGLGIYLPIYPFAVLAAGLYTRHGLIIYLLFVSGALLFSILANRLSVAVRRSEQHARELATLEKLGEAIIAAPPDQTRAWLPELLTDYAERMLPHARIAIWLEPDKTLVQLPAGRPPPNAADVRAAVREGSSHLLYHDVLVAEEKLGSRRHQGLAVPIKDEQGAVLGGIYVLQHRGAEKMEEYLFALQSLAGQIALALRRAEVYAQTVAGERMAQELAVAGRIQNSFLPHQVPSVPGWQIAATLVPARQTSGDFYDFIPLPDGRLGLVVADVADKGTGAALYMALTRTLIRTYAMAHPGEPRAALRAANERILSDTESDQFVTVFYGIFDAAAGTLTYCNAGHNPGFVLSAGNGTAVALPRTGIPLGMFPDMGWEQKCVPVTPHDTLLLYSDGVTEAQNRDEALFGEERLLHAVRSSPSHGAQALSEAIIAAIRGFTGDAPQFDDITLLIVAGDGREQPGAAAPAQAL